jgi:uncharacterized membrane protein
MFCGEEAFVLTPSGLQLLGTLPARESYARGISGDGTVTVGASYVLANGDYEAFRWTKGGGVRGLGRLEPGAFSSASDASADGSIIVGGATLDARARAFVWTERGGMRAIAHPPGFEGASGAAGITPDGRVVVGSMWPDLGLAPHFHTPGFAFRWTNEGGMVNIGRPVGTTSVHPTGVSDDGGTIVGTAYGWERHRPFRWTEQTGMSFLEEPEESRDTFARGMDSDAGVVVGDALLTSGPHLLTWSDRGMQGLEQVLEDRYAMTVPLDPVMVSAKAISSDGMTIAGEAYVDSRHVAYVIRLASPIDCYGDYFADGVKNVFDFVHFQQEFMLGEDEADCDQNARLDLYDFLCFQNAFVAGC